MSLHKYIIRIVRVCLPPVQLQPYLFSVAPRGLEKGMCFNVILVIQHVVSPTTFTIVSIFIMNINI
jgi:hypothetical protein